MDKFNEAFQKHKDGVSKSLIDSGESHRINKMLEKVESNVPSYRYYFEAGQQSQQSKVEGLQKRVHAALKLMQKPVIVGEPSNYVCARFKEIEQALKGEG